MSSPPTKLRRGMRAILSGPPIAATIAALVVVGAIALPVMAQSRAVQERIDEIRAAGYPMSAEELHEFYPPPDPDDGPHPGELYQEAWEFFRDPAFHERFDAVPYVRSHRVDVPRRGRPWPMEMVETSDAYLAELREARALVHEAAQMGPAWFEVRFEEGGYVLLHHLAYTRRFSELLRLEMARHAQQGRTDEAVESLVAMWGVARALEDEPIGIIQVTRHNFIGDTVEATQWLLHELDLTADHVRRIRDAASATQDDGRSMRRAIIGERAMVRITIERMQRDEIARNFYRSLDEGFNPTRHALDWYLTLYLGEVPTFLEKLYKKEYLAFFEEDLHDRWPWHHAMLEPLDNLWHIPQSILRRAFYRDVALVGLAVAHHRIERGEYPETLDDLVPDYLDAVPDDPFDPGAPLRYRRTETGAIVYSLGPNRTDHGGRELNDDGKRTMGNHDQRTDLTFTLGNAQAELWPEQWPEPTPPEPSTDVEQNHADPTNVDPSNATNGK